NPFVYLSSTRLSVYWSNTSLSAGTYDVMVTNPLSGGGQSASLPAVFKVVAPQPSLSGVIPSSLTYGVTLSGDVTILGTNFAPGATISIGTLTGTAIPSVAPATASTPFVYLSSGRLSFYWANTSLAPGSYTVTVTNPSAGGGLMAILPAAFTIVPPQPTLSGVSPSGVTYGVTPGGDVSIIGTNFAPGAIISVGNLTGAAVVLNTPATAAHPFVYLSSSKLSFYWANTSLLPGAYPVTVTNPAAGGGLSEILASAFAVVIPQPTLTGVSPSSATYGITPSSALTISGTNFVPGATISVGTLTGTAVTSTVPATAAHPFVYLSSSRISIYWLNTSLQVGTYNVTVTNPVAGGGLSISLPAAFSVDGLITAANPSAGAYRTPQSVSLMCTIKFSSCAATYYTTNGTIPTTSSAVYTTPILISSNTTLKFFSKDVAGNLEPVKTQTYIIDSVVPATLASPPGGSYGTSQTVSLACSDNNSGCSETYFTTDGSIPTVTSLLYTGPISIMADTTLKFFSTDKAGNEESVRTEVYTLLANATSGPVTLLTTNSANFSGVGNANGNSGTAWFEFGTDQTYGTNTTSQIISGNTPLDFHQDVNGLLANTFYHYRFCVSTTGNKVCGVDAAFVTRSAILGDAGNVSMLIPASANRIDGYDLEELGRAFGSDPSKTNWNALTDLNNDGIVDGKDLTIMAINFGKVQ
ncbi:MAG: chitobiase/beta-hexosaminidase C-terminal domain-containing protein, partial [Nitrospirae bacterium]|nr:chitobiase/beta-hexosaminidase C-terminal domain-containing protein [Nitrospirota bacterium]